MKQSAALHFLRAFWKAFRLMIGSCNEEPLSNRAFKNQKKILKQQFQDELANLEMQKLNSHCNTSK